MSVALSERIPCRYKVVKYIDDQEKFEPVNIGIILQSKTNNKTSTKFVDYRKLRYRFDNAPLIKLLLENINEEIVKDQTKEVLDQIASKYTGKLQFTEYRGALAKSLSQELDSLYKRFISIEQLQERIKIITLRYMRNNFWDYTHDRWSVKRNHLVEGKRSQFKYDFLFEKSNKIFQSISYDARDSLRKTKLFDWHVMDAISGNGLTTENFGAIISEPSEKNPRYDKVREQYKEGCAILESKNYDLIYFDETEKWKKQIKEFN